MENKACLDTDFLIDFLRNKKEKVEWIKNNSEASLATTIINVFELYYGEYKLESRKNLEKLEDFLNSFYILNLNNEIVKKAGEVAAQLEKQGNMLEFRDILIAVTASHNNYSLKTNNKKHFERIKDLKILDD